VCLLKRLEDTFSDLGTRHAGGKEP
jgi:hypothetical protein